MMFLFYFNKNALFMATEYEYPEIVQLLLTHPSIEVNEICI